MKKLSIFFFFLSALNVMGEDIVDEKQTGEEKNWVKVEKNRWEFDVKNYSISGIVLSPTAYRANGINEIGGSIDFNAAYYIGRLYAKNNFDWTMDKENYLDRIGIWYFETDGKLLIQRETKFFPSFSSGFKGIYTFRDSPQPSLTTPSASIKVTGKNTNSYTAIYFTISKQVSKNFILNVGYMDGEFNNFIYQTSEFLSENAIKAGGKELRISNSTVFAGFVYTAKKNPIGFEVLIPQGSTLSPKLINFQLGSLLKLNFQISYLTYKGGYEYLGTFNFRYSFYPRIFKEKKE